MNTQLNTPLLFLLFNRPDLTAKVFEKIREARPTRLYIAVDGPRAERPGEDLLVKECQAFAKNIDWSCEVNTLFRSENLGCKIAVSSAISWFFENEPEGIILEDDCLPDLSFFRFAGEMLERYREDSRVMSIASCNFFSASKQQFSYYFSKYPNIWGWATWRRVWCKYDVELKEWPASRALIGKRVKHTAAMDHFNHAFESIKLGVIDTWDYQLLHCHLLYEGLTIYPHQNLIKNIGFDARATHTVGCDNPSLTQGVRSLIFPLRHPPTIAIDEQMSDLAEHPFIPKSIASRFVRKFKRIIMIVSKLFLNINTR